MKILIVNSFCGIGSTGRICTDLADALIEKGHNVRIAYGRESAPDKYKNIVVRIGTDLNVKLMAYRQDFLIHTDLAQKTQQSNSLNGLTVIIRTFCICTTFMDIISILKCFLSGLKKT